MFASDVPAGTSPTIVASVILVVSLRRKSSAVSVSSAPELGGWDRAPSRPSGELVLKEKGSAQLSDAKDTVTATMTTTRLIRNIIALLLASQGVAPSRAEPTEIPLRVRDVLVKVTFRPEF